MDDRIAQVAAALKDIDVSIRALSSDDRTLLAMYGWNQPALNRHDLASMASAVAKRLEAGDHGKLSAKFDPEPTVSRIKDFKTQTLPQLFGNNGPIGVSMYMALLDHIDSAFGPMYTVNTDWEKLLNAGQLPRQVSGKLLSYKSRIKKFDADFAELGAKVAEINAAHEAATSLPTDLDELREATQAVMELRAAAEKAEVQAQNALDQINGCVETMRSRESEATQLLKNTEDAYSAATTRGLGEAFQTRANELTRSMAIWVIGLILALGAGALVGTLRIRALQELMMQKVSSEHINIALFLALISIAGPVWFAWIATKQIGHRFRLAEDYAFKASVAKAYEGYRREAARIDPTFSARLFGSALDRIDEAPIRFVESHTPGTPWQDVLSWVRRKNDISKQDSSPVGQD